MRRFQLILGLLALVIHLVARGGMAVILLGIIIGALLMPTLTA
ncbi:MAG: hypothetical protein RI601_00235 [Desulfurivibrionaceae bacterium]|nr:hypothetical protein [Desulfurivibrionaceae bacterium]